MRHGSRVPGQKPWWEPYLHGTAILLCSPYTLMCMTRKLAYKPLDRALTKRQDKIANTATPLPRKRRALSTTTVNGTPLGDSNGSLGLFNRLPRESRDLIYAEVQGNDVVRIWWDWDKERYARFDSADPFVKSGYTLSRSKVSFLGICRQIYIEAIGVLYTTNTFGFAWGVRHIEPYGYFFRTMRLHLLASITSVRIECSANTCRYPIADTDKQSWRMLWREMATKMPGSRYITLDMIYYEVWDRQQYRMYKVREAVLGRSILEFRGLKRLVLEMRGGYDRLRGHWEAVSRTDYEGQTGLSIRIQR